MTVLIVEDDPALMTILEYALQCSGYQAILAKDGEIALTLIREQKPDLVIADWMVPKISGIELCRILRRSPQFYLLPIIILTARTEEDDKLRGLETGADDYMTKPFSTKELLARVKSLLRRSLHLTPNSQLLYANLTLDLDHHQVYQEQELILLSPTEFKLLRHLLLNQGRPLTREQLLDAVWGQGHYIDLRTVDVHIGRLRQALYNPKKPNDPDIIRTVRSVGYMVDKLMSSPEI